MFFSELYGFGAMVEMAKQSDHMLAMIGAILILMILLSVIFYRFVTIYQSMKYEGEAEEKRVYTSELISLLLFALCLSILLLPSSFAYLRNIS